MQKLIWAITFLTIAVTANAQTYEPLVYYFNGTPTHGIKIKTQLPFQNGVGMPTVMIEGMDYGGYNVIDIKLNWYVYSGVFRNANASSSGAYAPEIKLANEGGNVVIYINDQGYFSRFNVRVFSHGKSETASMFDNWTVVDEPIEPGINIKTVTYNSDFGNGVVIDKTGNVGIGTTNPATKLQIAGGSDNWNESIQGQSKGTIHFDPENSTNHYGNSITFGASDSGNGEDAQAGIYVRSDASYGSKMYFSTTNSYGTGAKTALTINHNGALGIGTTSPASELDVRGTITSEEVKVEVVNPPDYVFAPDYQLRSLKETEDFIKANSHLPEIPSASEMEANGVELGEMNMLLLKKIEELTLHQIEQNKRIEKLTIELMKVKTDIK